VVVELKRGMASDDALAQVLRYIGWVKENLANGRNVRGLILAEGKDEKLKYALKSVSDVKVLRFKISIQIEEQ
jgi:RecB family endonuclease NucS